MKNFIIVILTISFIAVACSVPQGSGEILKAVSITEESAPTYSYNMDISALKSVPRGTGGVHMGATMDSIGVDGSLEGNLAVSITNELHPNYARWPGGGTLKFKHLMRPKGYGYDMTEITAYINGGGGTSKDLADWQHIYDEEQLMNYRFIDRFVQYMGDLAVKPKIIFGMNVTLGTVEENMDALDFLIANGIEVVAVEMGNETYQQFATFADYYAKSEPFLLAVKAAHPEIVRTMVIAPHPERNSHKKWNDAFKAKLSVTDLIQGGVPHFYPDLSVACNDAYDAYNTTPKPNFEILFDSKDPSVGPIVDLCNEDMKHMISDPAPAPGVAFNSFDGLKAMLDAQFPGLPLYMTEWNFLPVEIMGNTMADGFYAFKALLKIQENPNIVAATTHNFIAPAGHGMINPPLPDDSLSMALHKRVKYYAFLVHSMAQDGYQEATVSFSFPEITQKAYYKPGKSLIIGINESQNGIVIDSFGIPGYVTGACTIKAISGKQLYSSAGQNDYIGKNKFYDTHQAPYEINGMQVYSQIPPMSIFSMECNHDLWVAPPPPPPPPVSKPWYCKYFPWLKACKG